MVIFSLLCLLPAALRVVSECCLGVADFGAMGTGVAEDAGEVFRLDMAPYIGYGLVLEVTTQGTDPERTLAGDVRVKVFNGSELWIV